MKRNVVLPFFAASLLFVLPIAASASGLVPCGGPSNPCTLCHLITGISGVILTIRNIMFFVGLAIITAMGAMYVLSGGDSKMMETAKGGIKATLIGIVVILASWFIVNTVMFYVFAAKEDLGVGATFKGVDGFQFECNTASTSGTTIVSQIERATSGSVCEDPDTELARLKSGGTVCAGTGQCPSCDTSAYSGYITAASKKYGVPESLIKAFIAKDRGVRTSPGRPVIAGLCRSIPQDPLIRAIS